MASSISLLALLIFHVLLSGVVSDTTFTLLNNCNTTIWPGIKSSTTPPIKNTGFALEKGKSKTIIAPAEWVGQFWGRTHCAEDSTGNFTCLTGDCGSGRPACFDSRASARLATITEFATNISDGMDIFDVSVVNGYNLPILIVPKDKSGAIADCSSTSCSMDLNTTCPPELKVMSSDGEQVACQSACTAFGDAKHCCTGAYSGQDKCKPTSYTKVFKTACPTAHSILYDNDNTTFVCTDADFLITFCPTPNRTRTRKSGGECVNGTNSGADPKCLYKQGNDTQAPGPQSNTKPSGRGNTTKSSGQENTNSLGLGPMTNAEALRTGKTMSLPLKIGIAGVAASMLILSLLCFICYRRIKPRHNSSSYPKDVEDFITKYGPTIPKRFRRRACCYATRHPRILLRHYKMVKDEDLPTSKYVAQTLNLAHGVADCSSTS
ncbi:thaumatin-like protein 1b [Heracleum sosnowskyi]|uniref:Thaumatin-like protein 1b n=1 Tax=Heracleum sosnowskyi TaxID=360622 RepID=A0AAD8MP52_9APIA|nr:thaumatin-like protein 1b [Heracleum sosnowskyi]